MDLRSQFIRIYSLSLADVSCVQRLAVVLLALAVTMATIAVVRPPLLACCICPSRVLGFTGPGAAAVGGVPRRCLGRAPAWSCASPGAAAAGTRRLLGPLADSRCVPHSSPPRDPADPAHTDCALQYMRIGALALGGLTGFGNQSKLQGMADARLLEELDFRAHRLFPRASGSPSRSAKPPGAAASASAPSSSTRSTRCLAKYFPSIWSTGMSHL